MEAIPSDAELSVRRSRARYRTLIALASLGEAYVSQLARATGLHPHQVKWALFGYPPRYAEDLALVPLGLVGVRASARGVKYVVTTRGRRKARSLTTRLARGRRVQ